MHLVPWDFDISGESYDGLFVSNGPGDPSLCGKTIENIRQVMWAWPGRNVVLICEFYRLGYVSSICESRVWDLHGKSTGELGGWCKVIQTTTWQ